MSALLKTNTLSRRRFVARALVCATILVALMATSATAASVQPEEPEPKAKQKDKQQAEPKDKQADGQKAKKKDKPSAKQKENKKGKQEKKKGKQKAGKKARAPEKVKQDRPKPPPEHHDAQLPGRGPGQRGPGQRGPGMRGQGERGDEFRPPPALWGRLSEQERQDVRSFVEENFPRMYVELERLKRNNPQRYQKRMQRVAAGVGELMEVMAISPERGELMLQERRLDMEIRYLSTRYKSVKNKEKREKIRKQMRELCANSFDCRHKRRAIQIREFEAKLGGLKQRHKEAQKMREQLITEEVKNRLENPGPRPRGPGKGR